MPTSGTGGNDQDAIDLTGVSDLQDIQPGATVTFRIVNYDASAGTGTWYINNITGDDLALTGVVSSIPNDAPVFSGMALSTASGSPLQIFENKIFARITDPEGDTVTITGVSAASAEGGSVSRGAGIITYTPAASFSGNDSFTVTIDDGFNTVDITITVSVSADPLFTSSANAPRLTDLPGGAKRIAFNGIPGRTYAIQRSTTLEPGSWQQIAAVAAAPDSTVSYDDSEPPQPAAFYRIAYPAE
jgi:hypothetical protein